MIRLVRVELTRLRWRRAVLCLVAAAVVIPLVILAARVYDTRPISDGDRAAAQAEVDREIEYQREEIARCLENPRDYGVDPDRAERQCERYLGYTPSVEDFLFRDELHVAGERTETGLAVVVVLAVLMLVVGTTYVGHDWNTGSMSNQLLFEARRLRVWAAKGVAVGLLAAVVSAVVLTLFWGAMTGIAAGRDLSPSGQDVTDVVQHALRGTTVVVAAALFGFALTMLSRSTVFTVGVLFVVSVAGGLLFGLLPQAALQWEPGHNAVAAVNGHAEYYVEVPESCYTDPAPTQGRTECVDTAEVSVQQGLGYYGTLLLVVGAVSAASYRRRDVP